MEVLYQLSYSPGPHRTIATYEGRKPAGSASGRGRLSVALPVSWDRQVGCYGRPRRDVEQRGDVPPARSATPERAGGAAAGGGAARRQLLTAPTGRTRSPETLERHPPRGHGKPCAADERPPGDQRCRDTGRPATATAAATSDARRRAATARGAGTPDTPPDPRQPDPATPWTADGRAARGASGGRDPRIREPARPDRCLRTSAPRWRGPDGQADQSTDGASRYRRSIS